MHVKHRVTLAGETPITRRQVNQNVAPVPQNLRRKGAVLLDVPSQAVRRHARAQIGEEIRFVYDAEKFRNLLLARESICQMLQEVLDSFRSEERRVGEECR